MTVRAAGRRPISTRVRTIHRDFLMRDAVTNKVRRASLARANEKRKCANGAIDERAAL